VQRLRKAGNINQPEMTANETFFSVLLPMTSRFVYVLESFSLFAVSSIKHASESYEDTHGRKAVQ
jgi:hypothetical protein